MNRIALVECAYCSLAARPAILKRLVQTITGNPLEETMAAVHVVFNLFCLEAWHIAVAYRIPSTAVHPYAIPAPGPRRSDWRRMIKYLPLCASCFERTSRTSSRFASGDPEREGRVSQVCMKHDDYMHWAWPLFNWPRWKSLWEALYQLPQRSICPSKWLPTLSVVPYTPLVYCTSPSLLVPQGRRASFVSAPFCGWVSGGVG